MENKQIVDTHKHENIFFFKGIPFIFIIYLFIYLLFIYLFI